MDECRGADEVGFLDEFEAGLFEFEAVAVEGAALVRDEDDAFEFVDLDEELELIDHAFFFEVGLRMAGDTRGSTGQAEAVVAGEIEAVLEEVVEVLAKSAVGAVECRGMDAGGVVLEFGFVCHAWCRGEGPVSWPPHATRWAEGAREAGAGRSSL